MVMKETVRSLRTYFILGGLATIFSAVSGLRSISQRQIGFETVEHMISVGFGLAFLYFGFSLPTLLRSSAGHIVTFLYISAGWSVLASLVGLLQGDSPFELLRVVLVLLILWYLLKNVRRLATETQLSPLESTPPSN
jgi:hypothetical protein